MIKETFYLLKYAHFLHETGFLTCPARSYEARVFDTGVTFLINILNAKGDILKDCFVSGLSLKASGIWFYFTIEFNLTCFLLN